jgi:hypothetical protein
LDRGKKNGYTIKKKSSIICKNPKNLMYKNATNYTILFIFAQWTFALMMFRLYIEIK